ncbi:penicillin-binding protein 1C [Pseudoroseicyclus tamaricis]|uniref:peptidoglycan glycosyltransferase n=1 Tax=Pseudoroseicyclus tamaricis TaxID=2705421 RepID=A0A6B2K434_9RHOB|nr:penicillin-binding protein 1C [Pseudoroseicyclus tamaricis]NDV02582.1 penicillin-binding protein 1C [Pseudoroseicyclus tamaricis]
MGLVALAALLWLAAFGHDRVSAWIAATDLPPLAVTHSPEVVDREGRLLRAYTVADGRWRLAVSLDAVDPDYIEMLIRYEDKRFREHGGVDAVAMARVAWQALRYQRFVAGGSTLTMQVARLLEDGPTGTLDGKLRQIRVALALEQRLSKDEILQIYLGRAPFGGNIEGVRAASYAWFGKPPHRLTAAESALLVALPQSPEGRRPDRHPEAARAARDRVLARMDGAGVITEEARLAAMTEPSPTGRRAFPLLAAHLADRARAADPLAEVIQTTLDAGLQVRIESLAARAAREAGQRQQVAIVVADHRTGEILASVGSAGYSADSREGFLDMTRAPRSPGSTLKPLIYGLAFDRGLAHPETILSDRPMDFAGYRPQNFDGLFRGDIRAREALQLSLNLPAVALLDAMGPQHLYSALLRAGASPQLPDAQAPGLAIALGGLGLSLTDLTAVYAALAHGGTRVDLRFTPGPTPGFRPTKLMGRAAAWQVADILSETPRPLGIREAEVAYKTGTSYGHRDALSVGFDGAHVVAVWMGRADGTPVPGVFGGAEAAPVMFAAFERIEGRRVPLPPPPPETLILAGAALPAPLQRFAPAGAAAEDPGPRIAFPPDGALVEGDALVARVSDGAGPFTWLANGAVVAQSHRRDVPLALGAGFSSLTVIDAEGRSASAHVEMR